MVGTCGRMAPLSLTTEIGTLNHWMDMKQFLAPTQAFSLNTGLEGQYGHLTPVWMFSWMVHIQHLLIIIIVLVLWHQAYSAHGCQFHVIKNSQHLLFVITKWQKWNKEHNKTAICCVHMNSLHGWTFVCNLHLIQFLIIAQEMYYVNQLQILAGMSTLKHLLNYFTIRNGKILTNLM